MASPEIIDLASLLAPIDGESPAGHDVRQDSSPTSNYQSIKTARAAARAAERSSVHDGDTSEADEHWRKIISLAPEILTKQSKDLEIATWFTEALVRRHGFQGLRDAFHLILGLIENFWDNLYPMPDDEDGMAFRTASLTGLNGEGSEGVLIPPIRKVPITEGQDPGPFSFWQYQQALDIQRSASEDIRNSKAEKLGFTLEDIERAVNESSEAFYVDLLDDVTDAIATYRKINQLLEERCSGEEAPPTRNIISILEECRGAISHLGKHKLPIAAEEAPAEEGATDTPSPAGAPAAPAVSVGAINSREAAFKQLLDIAKFFRKTEPHSPVSYVLEKAVKWGNMPLNELIVELIPDSSSRERYSELTGVKSNED
jgi:type VI secretion system protein ImpA